MIATIGGIVAAKTQDSAVIELGGLGYEVFMPANALIELPEGQPAKLYIHEHIKEDAHDLYGFNAPDDKRLFEQLLSVKNVGPRVAMAVLGIGTSEAVRQAIASGDIHLLQTAKGVGRRAAEQIVVELRDKVGLLVSQSAEEIVRRGGDGLINDDALEALISLGYNAHDATMALRNVDQSLPTDERVKEALRTYNNHKSSVGKRA